MVELEALDLLGLGEHDRPGGGVAASSGVELARVGDRGQVADEVAHRPAGLAARPRGGELGEAREALQPLGGLGGGGEQPMAAQPDPLDQPPHEDVGPHLLQRRRPRRAWSFRKAWIRSRASGGSCGLSSAASSAEIMSSLRRRAIVVHRARSIERSSTGGRVSARTTAAESVGIGEHPQPGEHVAHLGPLEEGGVAGEAERDPCAPRAPPPPGAPRATRSRRSRRRPRAAPRRPRAGARSPAPPPAPAARSPLQRQNLTSRLTPSPHAVELAAGRRRRASLGAAQRPPAAARGDRRAEAQGPVEDDLLGIGVAVQERGRGVADRDRGPADRLARVAGADAGCRARPPAPPAGRGGPLPRPRARRPSRTGSARRARRGRRPARRAGARARSPGRRRRGSRRRAGRGRGSRRGRRTPARGRARSRSAAPSRLALALSAQSRSRPGVTASAFSASMRRSSLASSPAGLPRISCRRSDSSSSRSSSIASRSAARTVAKKGSSPASRRVLAKQPLGRGLVGRDPELLVGSSIRAAARARRPVAAARERVSTMTRSGGGARRR